MNIRLRSITTMDVSDGCIPYVVTDLYLPFRRDHQSGQWKWEQYLPHHDFRPKFICEEDANL
ncbi:MAG: hypothetical protein IPG00_16340 [Saprospiraceae bacterium]|nr:hypothetical protein [Saprospiraceae bacterium]